MTRNHAFPVAAALAAAAASAALAGSSLAAPAGSPPANLCTLKVKAQLKALPVGTVCKPSRTAHVGTLTIEGANWGTTNHAVALQVYIQLPKSRFLAQIDKSGKKVALGNGGTAWVDSGPAGVSLYAWADGLGMIVLLKQPIGASGGSYAAPLLAFTKAVAKQV